MKKRFFALAAAVALCLSAAPVTALGAAPAKAGEFALSADGSHYTYTLPKAAPAHNYAAEAFSTTHAFRDVYTAQYGSDKGIVYDMVAHVMIEVLYNDTIAYGKDVQVLGFDQIANVQEMGAARLAVQKDMPFLGTFVFFRGGGSEKDYECILTREVTNYFSDEAPSDNKAYIAARSRVIGELEYYRSAVAGVSDDVEKLEIAGRLFDADSVYDKSAPYHPIPALLTKRGVCGSSNWAFSMVGNAVGVPSYYLHVANANHASTLVKPNGGALMVIDVTFGKRNPRVEAVSGWKNRGNVKWERAFGFTPEHYFPDVDIFAQLGGLS